MKLNSKRVCLECGWRGLRSNLLQARHPFIPGEKVFGCPTCRAVDSTRTCCDAAGCWQADTVGTPVEKGYLRTCWEHRPKEESDLSDANALKD